MYLSILVFLLKENQFSYKKCFRRNPMYLYKIVSTQLPHYTSPTLNTPLPQKSPVSNTFSSNRSSTLRLTSNAWQLYPDNTRNSASLSRYPGINNWLIPTIITINARRSRTTFGAHAHRINAYKYPKDNGSREN